MLHWLLKKLAPYYYWKYYARRNLMEWTVTIKGTVLQSCHTNGDFHYWTPDVIGHGGEVEWMTYKEAKLAAKGLNIAFFASFQPPKSEKRVIMHKSDFSKWKDYWYGGY